jgi:hypothetical protein
MQTVFSNMSDLILEVNPVRRSSTSQRRKAYTRLSNGVNLDKSSGTMGSMCNALFTI